MSAPASSLVTARPRSQDELGVRQVMLGVALALALVCVLVLGVLVLGTVVWLLL